MEKTAKSVKIRVNQFIKKYFNFFHLPHFVPPKWYKKLKKIIAKYFIASDKLEELQPLKDEEIENFNIDDIIDSFKSQNEYLENLDESLKSLYKSTIENADDLYSMLDGILATQNNYSWLNDTVIKEYKYIKKAVE